MSKTANITEFLNSRKVELASEAVELGVVDVITSYKKNALADVSKIVKDVASVKSSVDKLKSSYGFWSNNLKLADIRTKQIYDQVSQFEKLAKELGIDPKNQQAYKDAMDAIDRYSEVSDNIKEMQSLIASIGK